MSTPFSNPNMFPFLFFPVFRVSFPFSSFSFSSSFFLFLEANMLDRSSRGDLQSSVTSTLGALQEYIATKDQRALTKAVHSDHHHGKAAKEPALHTPRHSVEHSTPRSSRMRTRSPGVMPRQSRSVTRSPTRSLNGRFQGGLGTDVSMTSLGGGGNGSGAPDQKQAEIGAGVGTNYGVGGGARRPFISTSRTSSFFGDPLGRAEETP